MSCRLMVARSPIELPITVSGLAKATKRWLVCRVAFAKPVLYEVPTYLAGCPIGTLNRKTKRKKAMANKKQTEDYRKGLFSKIEPTVQNMNSIAEFHKIIMNYKKMLKLEKNGKI